MANRQSTAQHTAWRRDCASDADHLANINSHLTALLLAIENEIDCMSDTGAKRIAGSILMRLQDEAEDAGSDIRAAMSDLGIVEAAE